MYKPYAMHICMAVSSCHLKTSCPWHFSSLPSQPPTFRFFYQLSYVFIKPFVGPFHLICLIPAFFALFRLWLSLWCQTSTVLSRYSRSCRRLRRPFWRRPKGCRASVSLVQFKGLNFQLCRKFCMIKFWRWQWFHIRHISCQSWLRH